MLRKDATKINSIQKKMKNSVTYQLKCINNEREKNAKRGNIFQRAGKSTVSNKTAQQKKHFENADPLIEACINNDTQQVENILAIGVPIDECHTVLGYTALHAAAILDSVKILRALIQNGANVNSKAITKLQTPLHVAAMHGRAENIRELLTAGASKVDIDWKGRTPLEAASECHHLESQLLLTQAPAAPKNVSVSMLSPYSFRVSWDKDESLTPTYEEPRNAQGSSDDEISVLSLNFSVEWAVVGSFKKYSSLTSSTSYVVSGSLPGTHYEVRVKTFTKAGWGEFCEPITFRSTVDTPSNPLAPEVDSISDKEIRMVLHVPPGNGDDVRQFAVQVQSKGSLVAPQTNLSDVLSTNSEGGKWSNLWIGDVSVLQTRKDDHTACFFTAQKLESGCVYFFRTRARNVAGWSMYSAPSTAACTSDGPKSTLQTCTTMDVIWPKTFISGDVTIECFELQIRPAFSSTPWSVVDSNIPNQAYSVKNLTPSTGYTFRVRPLFSNGLWEDWGNCAISAPYYTKTVTPPAPSCLVLYEVGCDIVALGWHENTLDGNAPLFYELQSLEDYPEHSWKIVSKIASGISCYRVTGLSRGTPYRFRIRSKYTAGWSDFENWPNVVPTCALLPPSAPVFIEKTHYSIQLTWESSIIRDEKDSFFELIMQKFDDGETAASEDRPWKGEWTTLTSSCRRNTFICSSLQPLRSYIFRVRECDSDTNWTPYSDISRPIQTNRRM